MEQHITIQLINGNDLALARMNFMQERDIRRVHVDAVTDVSNTMLVINEALQTALQLPVIEGRKIYLTSTETVECDIVGPVEIEYNNRRETRSALVLPGSSQVSIGYSQIQMLEADVIKLPGINPINYY
jgi:hypothetical protein